MTIFNPGNIKFGLKDPKVGLGMGYLPWLDATSQNFQSFYHGTNVGADSPNVAMYVIKDLKIRYVQGKARGWGWPSISGTTPPLGLYPFKSTRIMNLNICRS